MCAVMEEEACGIWNDSASFWGMQKKRETDVGVSLMKNNMGCKKGIRRYVEARDSDEEDVEWMYGTRHVEEVSGWVVW